jgi:hypothetical protein
MQRRVTCDAFKPETCIVRAHSADNADNMVAVRAAPHQLHSMSRLGPESKHYCYPANV